MASDCIHWLALRRSTGCDQEVGSRLPVDRQDDPRDRWMMARFMVTIRTSRSQQDAFDYMADLRNFREWDPGVRSVRQINGSGGGPHSSFDVVVSGGRSRELTLRYETKKYESPRLVLIEAKSRMLTSTDRISISSESDACLVTYHAELKLNGPLQWAGFMLGPMFKRIGQRAVPGLVAALDGEVVAA